MLKGFIPLTSHSAMKFTLVKSMLIFLHLKYKMCLTKQYKIFFAVYTCQTRTSSCTMEPKGVNSVKFEKKKTYDFIKFMFEGDNFNMHLQLEYSSA